MRCVFAMQERSEQKLLRVPVTEPHGLEPAPGGGTSVDFEHGGWNETDAAGRLKFTDWRLTLDRFAHLADEGTVPPARMP